MTETLVFPMQSWWQNHWCFLCSLDDRNPAVSYAVLMTETLACAVLLTGPLVSLMQFCWQSPWCFLCSLDDRNPIMCSLSDRTPGVSNEVLLTEPLVFPMQSWWQKLWCFLCSLADFSSSFSDDLLTLRWDQKCSQYWQNNGWFRNF